MPSHPGRKVPFHPHPSREMANVASELLDDRLGFDSGSQGSRNNSRNSIELGGSAASGFAHPCEHLAKPLPVTLVDRDVETAASRFDLLRIPEVRTGLALGASTRPPEEQRLPSFR